METWKNVPGFPKYAISDYGRIRRHDVDHYLEPKINQNGVVFVGLMKEGVQYQRSVALLVALAFIPKPSEAFDTPINLDGNRFANNVLNLAWRPRWFAREYNRQFKERFPSPIEYPIVDLQSGIEYPDSFTVAKLFGLLESHVVVSVLHQTPVWPTGQQFAPVSY